MRILVVAPGYPVGPDDPELSFVRDQAEALADEGHHVEVLVLSRVRAAVAGRLVVRHRRYLPLPLRVGFGAWRWSILAQLRITSPTPRGSADVAVVHSELLGAIIEPTLRRAGIPWVLVVHGQNFEPALATTRAKQVLATTLAASSQVVAVGTGITVDPAISVEVIENGHRPMTAAPRSPGPGCTAISVSGLRPGKGIEDNVAALAALRREGHDVRYVVVGDGVLRPTLTTLAAAAGVDDAVTFVGSADRRRVGALLAEADFFSLPSAPEAFGIATVEAMSAGLPVIVRSGTGPAAFVTDGVEGLVVDGRVDALTSAWRRLVTDHGLRADLGARGRLRAQDMTWKRNAERLVPLLQRAVDQHGGRSVTWLCIEPTRYMQSMTEAVKEHGSNEVHVAYLARPGAARHALVGIALGRAAVVVVEGWSHPTMVAAMVLATIRRAPFVVGSDTWRSRDRHGALRGAARRLLLRVLVARAKVVLGAGTPQVRYARTLLGPKIDARISHMTVDTELFARRADALGPARRELLRSAWGAGPEDVVFLQAGDLVAGKGVDLLLDLSGSVGPNVRFAFAGDGPLGDDIDRAAASGRPVVRLGRLTAEDLADAYAAADVVVLASRQEQWGLVVNEAMAAGRPVLVSDAVGCAEDLVDLTTGRVFRSGDLAHLAQQVADLAADEDGRGRLGAAGRSRIASWSLRQFVQAFDDAIERAGS